MNVRKSEDLIQTDKRPRFAGDWFRRKMAIKAAVTDAGKWRAFVAERVRQYRAGKPPTEAWEGAYRVVTGQAEAEREYPDADLLAAIGDRVGPSFGEILVWVFHHAGLEPDMIPLADWPCRGAVRMLRFASEDYKSFQTILIKNLPTLPPPEAPPVPARPKDDGRLFSLLDKLQAEFDAENRAARDSVGR